MLRDSIHPQLFLSLAKANNKRHITAEKEEMSHLVKTARIAGVLYLLVGIFGGLAEGYPRPKILGPGIRLDVSGKLI